MRDFNVDLLDVQNRSLDVIKNTWSAFFYLPVITVPTRITAHTKTCIDNIYSNNVANDFRSGVSLSGISDDFPFYLFQPLQEKSRNESLKIFQRGWSDEAQ